jgi:hypothetical protein
VLAGTCMGAVSPVALDAFLAIPSLSRDVRFNVIPTDAWDCALQFAPIVRPGAVEKNEATASNQP